MTRKSFQAFTLALVLATTTTTAYTSPKKQNVAAMTSTKVSSPQAAQQSPYYGKRLPSSLTFDSDEIQGLGEELPPSENNPPRTLPIINSNYEGDDGCYVACYSRDSENASYKLSNEDIYVMGLFRLQGSYEGRICRPSADGHADISAIESYKKACGALLREACNEETMNCWVGGDTGGFFGYNDVEDEGSREVE